MSAGKNSRARPIELYSGIRVELTSSSGATSVAPIPVWDGIRVDSPETLAEVLRLLDSLEDIKTRMLPGVSRFRVREEPKRVVEPRHGRKVIG